MAPPLRKPAGAQAAPSALPYPLIASVCSLPWFYMRQKMQAAVISMSGAGSGLLLIRRGFFKEPDAARYNKGNVEHLDKAGDDDSGYAADQVFDPGILTQNHRIVNSTFK